MIWIYIYISYIIIYHHISSYPSLNDDSFLAPHKHLSLLVVHLSPGQDMFSSEFASSWPMATAGSLAHRLLLAQSITADKGQLLQATWDLDRWWKVPEKGHRNSEFSHEEKWFSTATSGISIGLMSSLQFVSMLIVINLVRFSLVSIPTSIEHRCTHAYTTHISTHDITWRNVT